MKLYSLLFTLIAMLRLVPALPAGVVFSERFNYPDGPLTRAPKSPWVTHAGIPDQVDLVGGLVQLTQKESEDVHAPLHGSPYSEGRLFASFAVSFSELPSGEGGFFLHFKDGGSTHKARVYASTNGAALGRFRLGIANGSTVPALIPSDLQLTATYRMVVRYEATAPTSSTLWIDPQSEDDVSRRAQANDADRAASISAVALRQSLSSGEGMGVLSIGELVVGTEFEDVAGTNTPPTLSPIPNQSMGADQIVGPLFFTVADRETAAEKLEVRVESNNLSLVSAKSVSFGGQGSERWIRVQPAPGLQGAALLTLIVSDGVKSTSTTFTITVGLPTLRGPEFVETQINQAAPELTFEIQDRESAPEQLLLTATADNAALLPSSGIQWKGTGLQRQLRLTPASGRTGISTLTIKLSDGIHSLTQHVALTVSPNLGVLIAEEFNPADGPLVQAGTPWSIHAPENGQATNVLVKSGQLQLSSKRQEDVHIDLPGGPYSVTAGAIFYAGMSLQCLELPGTSGGYFAHFRDDRSGFRARLHTRLSEEAPQRYELGISSGAEDPVFHSDRFATGQVLVVVTKYNSAIGKASLWINAAMESQPAQVNSQDASALPISNWAFRQTEGIGGFQIDSLRVAGRYDEAVPGGTGPKLNARLVSGSVLLRWPTTPEVELQQKERLTTNPWASSPIPILIDGAFSEARVIATESGAFFRLGPR